MESVTKRAKPTAQQRVDSWDRSVKVGAQVTHEKSAVEGRIILHRLCGVCLGPSEDKRKRRPTPTHLQALLYTRKRASRLALFGRDIETMRLALRHN